MAVSSSFGRSQNTTVSAVIRSITGITTFNLDSVDVDSTALLPERKITLQTTVDGDVYEVTIVYNDNLFYDTDFLGQKLGRGEEEPDRGSTAI